MAIAPLHYAPIEPAKDRASIEWVLRHADTYWYEKKYDGFRCLSFVDGENAVLTTKHRNIENRFNDIRIDLGSLGFESVVFDGEIVVVDETGEPNFRALVKGKKALEKGDKKRLYYVWDMLEVNGREIWHLPYKERKHWLKEFISRVDQQQSLVRYVPCYEGIQGIELLKQVLVNDLEGVVAKHPNHSYELGIPYNWVKIRKLDYSQDIGRGTLFLK